MQLNKWILQDERCLQVTFSNKCSYHEELLEKNRPVSLYQKNIAIVVKIFRNINDLFPNPTKNNLGKIF